MIISPEYMDDGEVQYPIDDRVLLLYSSVLLDHHVIKLVYFKLKLYFINLILKIKLLK